MMILQLCSLGSVSRFALVFEWSWWEITTKATGGKGKKMRAQLATFKKWVDEHHDAESLQALTASTQPLCRPQHLLTSKA